MPHRRLRVLAVAAIVAVALLAVAHNKATSGDARRVLTIRVAADERLESALATIAATYETSSGVRIEFEFASTGQLEQRLLDGERADVFISASPLQVASLASRRLIKPFEASTIACDRLAIFVEAANPKKILGPDDLQLADAIVTGDPNVEPPGTSAREWLRGVGLWASLEPKVVFSADASTTAELLSEGTADACVGFASEVLGNPALSVVYVVPDDKVTDIRYVAAPIQSSAEPEAARAFVTYLLSAESQAVFTQHGLQPAVP